MEIEELVKKAKSIFLYRKDQKLRVPDEGTGTAGSFHQKERTGDSKGFILGSE